VTSGDAELPDTLTLGGAPCPVVVDVHGASEGTRDGLLPHHLVGILPRQGIGVLAFDRRREGESTGEPLEILADDVRAGLGALAGEGGVDDARIGAFAHERGGWIAPLAATGDARVACRLAVAPSGAPPGEHVDDARANLLREDGCEDEIVEEALDLRTAVASAVAGESPVEHARARLAEAAAEPWLDLAFVEDAETAANRVRARWMGFHVRPAPGSLTCQVLLVAGGHDRWVPVERTVAAWREGLGDRLDVLRLDEAGRCPTRPRDAGDRLEHGPPVPEYERTLVEWVDIRLAVGPAP
jgi:pimeloyl-ACP methyl ester carboxylesterase